MTEQIVKVEVHKSKPRNEVVEYPNIDLSMIEKVKHKKMASHGY